MISRTPFAIAVAVTSVLGLMATDAVADPVVDRDKDRTRRAIHRTAQQTAPRPQRGRLRAIQQ
jgi:hypothetical protein